jgi:hypothetical protein
LDHHRTHVLIERNYEVDKEVEVVMRLKKFSEPFACHGAAQGIFDDAVTHTQSFLAWKSNVSPLL